MTEEIKEELKEQKAEKCDCKCGGKCVKVFLLGVLASFLGCLLALLIFSAATKPQMPPAPMMFGPPQAQQFHHGKFKHGEFKKHKMHKKFQKGDFEKRADFDSDKRDLKPDYDED